MSRSGIILLILGWTTLSQGAHILFLQQYASYSHIAVTWPLATSLQASGHQVSYIASTPGPSHSPNISYFVPSGLGKALEEALTQDFGLKYRLAGGWNGGNSIPLFLISPRSNPILCQALLSSEDFQAWITNPDIKVDLVIIDSNLDCGLGVAWRLRAKVVVFQLFGPFFETLDALGGGGGANEMVSNILIPYNNPLSLFQRVKTTLASLVNHVATRWMWTRVEDLFRTYLAQDYEQVPSIGEMVKNVSLVMTNGHFLEEHGRPYPPNFVSVPGLHVKEAHSALNEDVENFIQKSEVGFIYISLGTVVNLDELPETFKAMFFNAMRVFPEVMFLWKWDAKQTPNKLPGNLYLSKWYSQQDVLGHPKILGFVSQTGRPSLQEALFNAVPLVTLPVFGDQDYNSFMMEDLGVSVNLEIAELTTDKLVAAFRKLVNKEMKAKSLEVAVIMKDTPMKPVDKAMWWIEYVLRHNSTSHLQPLSMGRSWPVKWLLDVWLSIFAATILTSYILITLLTKILKALGIITNKQRTQTQRKIKVK